MTKYTDMTVWDGVDDWMFDIDMPLFEYEMLLSQEYALPPTPKKSKKLKTVKELRLHYNGAVVTTGGFVISNGILSHK